MDIWGRKNWQQQSIFKLRYFKSYIRLQSLSYFETFYSVLKIFLRILGVYQKLNIR